MSIIDFSFVVISACIVIVTVLTVAISIATYRLIRRMQIMVEKIDGRITPSVDKLARTVDTFTESFRMANDLVAFLRNVRKKKSSNQSTSGGTTT